MDFEIVKADSGSDVVIWLVLGVFWLIAQGISKLRGGQPHPPNRPPPIITGDRSIEEDLQTLFEQLQGQAQPPRPPTPPMAQPMKLTPQGMDRRTPKPKHSKHKPVAPLTPVELAVPSTPGIDENPIEVGAIVTVSKSRIRGGMFKESLLSFSSIKTPLPAAKPIGVSAMGTGAHLRQLIKGRQQLKQAMISRIVLAPPKAFSI